MEQHKKIGKFNIFVGFLVLTAVTLWGGYFVVNKQNNSASISRQITQILQKNEQPVANCHPDPSNQEQDSDNDGLKDWEELTWKTDPCIPDTDKDGYLDGEETAAGYNPLQPSPGDKLPDREVSPRALPGNLTQSLAKNLAQKTVEGQIQPMTNETDFDALSANHPVISKAIQEVIDQSYEEFTLPNISDEEIVISDNNSSEAIQFYRQQVSQTMNKWAGEIGIDRGELFETETHLFYEAIRSRDFTEINKYIKFHEKIYDEIKKIPVPSEFKDTHKAQLGIFWIMNNIYKAIRQIDADPIKTTLALEQYEAVNNLSLQLAEEIFNRLQIE